MPQKDFSEISRTHSRFLPFLGDCGEGPMPIRQHRYLPGVPSAWDFPPGSRSTRGLLQLECQMRTLDSPPVPSAPPGGGVRGQLFHLTPSYYPYGQIILMSPTGESSSAPGQQPVSRRHLQTGSVDRGARRATLFCSICHEWLVKFISRQESELRVNLSAPCMWNTIKIRQLILV